MSVQGQGSVSAVLDAIRTITRMIRSGSLVGPHTHTARKGGPIQTDTTMRFRNALQPMFDSDSQMLNTNLNADLWRGQRYYVQSKAPKYANKGDVWFDGATFSTWNGTKWVSGSLTGVLAALGNQSANLVLAGPSSGVAALAAFRALVLGDLPAPFNASPLSIAGGGTNNTAAYAAGSVIFSDGTKLAEDNANLFYNAIKKSVQLGTSTNDARVTIGANPGGIQFVAGSQLPNANLPGIGTTAGTDLVINAPTGQTFLFQSAGTIVMKWLDIFFVYKSVNTVGYGLPPIYGLDNRRGLTTTDGAAITLYTSTSGTQLYRLSGRILATTLGAGGAATLTLKWTEGGTVISQTITISAINTEGNFEGLIQPDNATAITTQLTAISGVGTTVNVAATVEELA